MFNLNSMSQYELENLKRIVYMAESRYDELNMADKAESMCHLWLDIVFELRCRREEEES